MDDQNDDLVRWRTIQCKLNRLFVHDLKNPISALAANLSFLESAPLESSEEARGAISDSALAANMLLRLADNFDMIAMLEAGDTGLMGQVKVADYVRSALRRNKNIAGSAGIRLGASEPLIDASQYWQTGYSDLIIDNLIMSAVRHSPQGGEVLVSTELADKEIRISVCDHGPPVAEEYINRLFTRESQVEAKRNPGCRYGRGLGLYAVGMAAEALGGRVEVGTNDGMAEFTLVVQHIELPPDE